MSNILTRILKFPPVTFILIFLVSFIAFQGYLQYTGAGTTLEVQHIEPTIITDDHRYQTGSWMQITVKIAEDHHDGEAGHGEEAGDHHDEEEAEADDHHHEEEEGAEDQHRHDEAEAEAEDHHHDDEVEDEDHAGDGQLEGSVVRIVIYSPDGNVFAVKEGTVNHDGEVAFDVFIESDSPAGIYTIVPEVTVDGLPTLIGETITVEVS